ncbi:protein phosphatase 1, regulatory subunit 3Db [Mastacembelus armatus]|uniref:Protein phosphatase 1, regulatory subunit 3Db n=1 Tax=Mastacembelus armatus TaxID=205130 RepID=A0A3Q3N536_9TELE|nr:protein phosphatase 1 regulatory subunit 3D-like [Mastacembelus armatus]
MQEHSSATEYKPSLLQRCFYVVNMAGTCDKWQQRGSGEDSGTQLQFISGSNSISNSKNITIRLRDIYDPKPQPPKPPVRIRPPGPRPLSVNQPALKHSLSSEPSTKTIMRRRAQSLHSFVERNKKPRSPQVRFVDSLGLELEEVKVFRVHEHPLIPQHVLFRLMMNSELAFGKSAELSLPYFKPCFPENMGAHPDFLKRLCTQCVCLEQVLCSEYGITGTVQVLNLAYEKEVTVHYSFTNWRTHTDTRASWASRGNHEEGKGPDTDIFRFRLPVPPFILQPGSVLEFAICYHVKGCDYWDNNNGCNYKLSCHSYKVTVPRECEDSMLHFI